jgi:hypothetical protein
MQACLKEQLDRNIKVYVGNIIIETTKANSLLDDLREIFNNSTVTASSSTRRSIPSMYLPASSWGTSSLREGSKEIQKRFERSLTCSSRSRRHFDMSSS